jgi:hypothetical protein
VEFADCIFSWHCQDSQNAAIGFAAPTLGGGCAGMPFRVWHNGVFSKVLICIRTSGHTPILRNAPQLPTELPGESLVSDGWYEVFGAGFDETIGNGISTSLFVSWRPCVA